MPFVLGLTLTILTLLTPPLPKRAPSKLGSNLHLLRMDYLTLEFGGKRQCRCNFPPLNFVHTLIGGPQAHFFIGPTQRKTLKHTHFTILYNLILVLISIFDNFSWSCFSFLAVFKLNFRFSPIDKTKDLNGDPWQITPFLTCCGCPELVEWPLRKLTLLEKGDQGGANPSHFHSFNKTEFAKF